MINSRLCHFSCTLPTYRVLKKGLKLRGSCFECKKFRVGMNVKSCFTRKCPVSMRISSYFECEASKSYFVQSLFLCVLIKSISPPAMGPFYLWSLQWSLGTLLKHLNSDPKEIESLKMQRQLKDVEHVKDTAHLKDVEHLQDVEHLKNVEHLKGGRASSKGYRASKGV